MAHSSNSLFGVPNEALSRLQATLCRFEFYNSMPARLSFFVAASTDLGKFYVLYKSNLAYCIIRISFAMNFNNCDRLIGFSLLTKLLSSIYKRLRAISRGKCRY